jgi:hypothetical protein
MKRQVRPHGISAPLLDQRGESSQIKMNTLRLSYSHHLVSAFLEFIRHDFNTALVPISFETILHILDVP